ncbi:hypothetical protein PRJ39_21230 [Lysobacter enzymogenes]|uniref:hypothetical protein n=1 Tax=Lysobacter enzymogenes TaxID=69 RepID=UPI003749B02F
MHARDDRMAMAAGRIAGPRPDAAAASAFRAGPARRGRRCRWTQRLRSATLRIKTLGNKKARSRMNRLRACSLPHVGMRADREGSVSGFARCTAKQNLPVHLKRSRAKPPSNAKTLRRKACYR